MRSRVRNSTNSVTLSIIRIPHRPNRRALAVFKETIRIDQAFYPERLKAVYIINAPLIFRPIWAAVRPWLDPLTKDKFHILGSSYQDTLFEKIAPDNLPQEYGGTMKAGLPLLVPLPADRFAWARERAKDIEAGDTSRGHLTSAEMAAKAAYPPVKPMPSKAPSAVPGRGTRVAPWIIRGESGSMWI
eukprot:m.162348 g.162348  ORF g.162348 m.162348 type:complete len:187 (+) comp23871_c0_seq1:741-1301(+)